MHGFTEDYAIATVRDTKPSRCDGGTGGPDDPTPESRPAELAVGPAPRGRRWALRPVYFQGKTLTGRLFAAPRPPHDWAESMGSRGRVAADFSVR